METPKTTPTSTRAWAVTAAEALAAVNLAINEAKTEVPQEIRVEQWVAAKHMMQASAWEMIGLKYRQPLYTALYLLSNAKAALETVLEHDTHEETPPNLKLGKMRRSS